MGPRAQVGDWSWTQDTSCDREGCVGGSSCRMLGSSPGGEPIFPLKDERFEVVNKKDSLGRPEESVAVLQNRKVNLLGN